ncbi:MAG: M67 family metallopeptidase [Candidatus Omnitrophica bacterium]|nr:M67 family metallopeptidase [Candidatus Omnitrophota bacterium]
MLAETVSLNKLPKAILEIITKQAESEYPHECCGMILARENSPEELVKVYPCRNAQNEYHAENLENFPRTAKEAYFIEPSELLAIQKENRRQGLIVRVIYHSHIDTEAYFSREDKKMALPDGEPAYPGVDYLVLSVMGGKVSGMNFFHWDTVKKDFIS